MTIPAVSNSPTAAPIPSAPNDKESAAKFQLAEQVTKTFHALFQTAAGAPPSVPFPLKTVIPHSIEAETLVKSNHEGTIKLSMAKAEEKFKKFDEATEKDKEELATDLKTAYSNLQEVYSQYNNGLPKHLEGVATRLFFLYGKKLYGGDMVAAQKMFQLSLSFTLSSINTSLPKPSLTGCKTLESLQKFFESNPNTFDVMDKYLLETSNDELMKLILANPSSFEIASTIRDIGATYQNIDSYKQDLPRFEKYFNLPKAIFKAIDTHESRWQVADIIYNTGRLIHYLKKPGDVTGALATLEEMQPYLKAEGNSLKAIVKQAQIHNITAIEQDNIKEKDAKLKRSIFASYSKAAEIARETPNFPFYFKTLFMNNCARTALDFLKEGVRVAPDEYVTIRFEEILKLIKEEKYNHYYHAGFVLNAARAEFQLNNNKAKALELLALAEDITKKYPKSSKVYQERIETLRKEIAGGITLT